MRAFVVNKLSHPSNIALDANAPEPRAGSSQVLVDVYSAGLNFFDASSHPCPRLRILMSSHVHRFCKRRESTSISHPFLSR